MDTADPLTSTTWPNNQGTSSSASLRLGRKRTQTSLRRAAGKDGQTRQSSPRAPAVATGKDMIIQQSKPATTKSTAKTPTRGASAASKPLVPLSERRVREAKKNLVGTKENDSEKWDIAPDGSSGGREGRQFTVANVGNNGRIYLRPSVRPANQRYPQPNFTFPVTPPSTAVVDSWNQGPAAKKVEARGDQDDASNLQSTQWTPTTTSVAPLGGQAPYFATSEGLSQSQQHRRAVSDSTVHDAANVKEQHRDTFKVTITKPADRDESRPRTMDALNTNGGPPLLDVNIPSWRLGAPRFTLRGTPLLRGSSYAPTEDMRSSGLSGLNSSWSYNLSVPGIAARRPNPLALPMNRMPHVAQRGDSSLPSPRMQHPLRSTYMSTHLAIEPSMFTDLTFQPACDDRSIVRYSPAGVVTAATPPRLVAEITSPSFLDYELISDFFLTYRSFLEPVNLLRMLIARLRWALDRDDEPGMIVRVRTFVALRHWILNYFVDDFLVDYDLRLTFCTLVNDLVNELCQDVSSRRSQIKIVAELKKCWRRVCAQFWDGAEFDDLLGSEVAITPGGVTGNRNPGMEASMEPHGAERTSQGDAAAQSHRQIVRNVHAGASFYGDIPKTVQVGDCVVLDNRPGTPEDQVGGQTYSKNSPHSPLSMASLDVVSCSFPTKNLKVFNPNTAHLMAAHPVSSTSPSVVNSNGPIATTPKSLVGKRVRPNQVHKRNISLSDSLRDHGSDKTPSTDQDWASAMPPGGSLVRGNLLPPAQAFVSIEPHAYGHSYRQTTIFQSGGRNFTKDRALGGAMSGYGMRKLLRSVRKVLKTRAHGTYSTQSNLMDIQPIGPRGATTNRLPGTAVVPQEMRRQNGQNGPRPPVRIDLLGAEVAEDFKKAIREEEEAIAAAADPEQLGGISLQGPNSVPLPTYPEYAAAQMDSTTLEALTLNQNRRPISDMGITIGSKSIVIVDDTVSFEIPSIQGTCRAENPAPDTPAATLMRGGGADPTPPNTPPPGHPLEAETPSRRSDLPSQHETRPFLEDNILPPFIPDLDTLGGHQSSQASREPSQPSLLAMQQAGRQPAVGGAILLSHRTRSTKTHQSLNSILHRRITSLGSASIPPTIRSFDATTNSSGLDDEPRSEAAATSPLRVLRRRPGGDLKAATHIGDLNPSILRRSRSVGSLATFTESIRSSYMFATRPNSSGDHENSHKRNAQDRAGMFSLGQLAEKGLKRDISLFSTHSSKPNMRPSFEAEAQRLAQIPDEENDGIESALLKLEGKYPKKPMKLSIVGQSPEVSKNTVNGDEPPMPPVGPQGNPTNILGEVQQQNNNDKTSSTDSTQVDEANFAPPIDQRVRKVQKSSRGQRSFLSESSLESDYSIPLLDRGLVDDAPQAALRVWAGRSILRGSDDEESAAESEQKRDTTSRSGTKHSSFDVVQRTDSIEKIKAGDTLPSLSWDMADESFLRDGSDTDLSSEISETNLDSQDAERREDSLSGDGPPAHSFTNEPTVSPSQLIPDPPKAMAQALAISPPENNPPSKPDLWSSKPLPPTPELTPVMSCIDNLNFGEDVTSKPQRTFGASKHGAGGNLKYSVHLPFILAFDSDILAQQFTLIEKDALNEIDWKELIDMNWKNSASNNSRSWVDFLRHTDAQGVDVVIARFNIMVKWALSEIVLTQHVEERARCIIKLIHIASHCRRYRNFATMAQLTIALSSNEIARLPRTWELVPASDLKTLNDLELLVTPSRNFRSIREEMEMGADAGCIPFVGIYTHDLLYNAQRASEIASSPSTAPLVNFEKYRMGASVVKTLLRLLEASTRYTFQPIEGVTERCLWIGALSDEDIRERCQSLE